MTICLKVKIKIYFIFIIINEYTIYNNNFNSIIFVLQKQYVNEDRHISCSSSVFIIHHLLIYIFFLNDANFVKVKQVEKIVL